LSLAANRLIPSLDLGACRAKAGPGGSPRIPRVARDREAGTRMLEFVVEIWSFLRVRKKFWLFPILLIMALLGVLIVLAEGSVIAPFIYSLF
jgi:hypothetical protein